MLCATSGQAEVWNASMTGLLLVTKPHTLQVGQKIEVEIEIADTAWTRMMVEVRWCGPNGRFGLKIDLPSVSWAQMIRAIQQPYELLALQSQKQAA